MRIAIDARELLGRPTGVGRYLAEILSAWNEIPAAAAHEFVLCAPTAVPLSPAPGIRVSTLCQAGGGGTWWEQRVLPRLVGQAGADVLFAPAYTAPIRCPAPTVLSVHDVSFAAHPEWFTWREGLRRRVVTRLAARRASRVLTLTEFSKQEIERHLGIAPDRIVVTSAGVSRLVPGSPGSDGDTDAVSARPATAGAPRVLYVGSIFARRQVPALIEGFARFAEHRPGASLDIVGDNRTTPPLDLQAVARRAGVHDRVRVRAYVTDAELSALYAGADAFVWLSSYEGFGLPPLEALAAAVPVVLLATPVAREVCGDAATYVADTSAAAIAEGLERVLFDPAERRRVLEASRAVLARCSWRACAVRVLDALTQPAA